MSSSNPNSPPPRRSCHAVLGHQVLLEIDDAYRQVQELLEQDVSSWAASRLEADESPEPVTIPVVVHIVYETEEQNISDEQIHSQIEVLNQDFRMQNPDVEEVPEEFADDVADCNIEFELASRDPNGQATDGITRTQTSEQSFRYTPFARTGPERNPVKFNQSGGTAAWPRNRYLNIWVCNLKGWDGRTLLGHASFPGGRAREDGVVVNYPYFGTTGIATPPYDGGRTATHEVGHWMNLRHIWGDDEGCLNSDFVEDTPNQTGPNYQCPTHPSITCSEGALLT